MAIAPELSSLKVENQHPFLTFFIRSRGLFGIGIAAENAAAELIWKFLRDNGAPLLSFESNNSIIGSMNNRSTWLRAFLSYVKTRKVPTTIDNKLASNVIINASNIRDAANEVTAATEAIAKALVESRHTGNETTKLSEGMWGAIKQANRAGGDLYSSLRQQRRRAKFADLSSIPNQDLEAFERELFRKTRDRSRYQFSLSWTRRKHQGIVRRRNYRSSY